MADKLKTARDESQQGQVKDLHDKMRRLKKHQAFEAEVMANTDRIRDIKSVSRCFPIDRITWVPFAFMDFSLYRKESS